MDRVAAGGTRDASAWFWLVLVLGFALVCEVTAVRSADIGLAVSGVGFAVMSAFAFQCPISLRANVRESLRPPKTADPKVAILCGVGLLLNVVGLAVRFLS